MMLGVICGFDGEVACFRRAAEKAGLSNAPFQIMPSGSSATQAQEIAETLVLSGATKLLSFGIAGGLDPSLQVGDVIFSNRIVSDIGQNTPQKQAPSAKALRMKGPILRDATLLGLDRVICTPAEKASLYRTFHTAAVDIESHKVADIATRHALPFHALRVISDSAADTLPSYVANAVSKTGKPLLSNIILGLMTAPQSLPALLRLGRNTSKALANLEQSAIQILPHLMREKR